MVEDKYFHFGLFEELNEEVANRLKDENYYTK